MGEARLSLREGFDSENMKAFQREKSRIEINRNKTAYFQTIEAYSR